MKTNDRTGSGPMTRLGWCAALSAGVALGAAPAHAQEAITIMPLGDSITEGFHEHAFSGSSYPESAYRNEPGGPPSTLSSYREHLHDMLTFDSCGADVEWVGARKVDGRVPLMHEGHGGWHASYFRELTWFDVNGVFPGTMNLDGWLETVDPDVVTLHIGTNGLGRTKTAAQNVDDIEEILDVTFALDPTTRVFLANVIPNVGESGARATTLAGAQATVREETEILSGLINELAANQAALGRNVVLVDVSTDYYINEDDVVSCPAETGGDPQNMSLTDCVPSRFDAEVSVPDGVHPNLKGDRFVADQFFAAMRASGGFCDSDPAFVSSTPIVPAVIPESDVVDPTISALVDLLSNWRHGR